jgi:hypothetical protein
MTTSLEFVTLNDSEAKAVLTNHVELRPDGEVIAVTVPADLAPEVHAVLRSLADSFDAGHAARLLIEYLTPQRPLSRGAVLQAHRNSVARAALAAEFGLLSSIEVAELSGSAARNTGATAARWRAAGRILAVTSGGFQFDAAGQPVPVIAGILAALADRLDPWSVALWFTGDNARLGGLRPVDALAGDPDAVLAAARALADDLT